MNMHQMMLSQWDMQRQSFDNDPINMTKEEAIHFIHWNITALTDELHEVLGEIGWKPWASSKHINADAALKEMVDAWHFFMNILLAIWPHLEDPPDNLATFTNQFMAAYFAKHEINRQRQAEGYDGVSSKCQVCKRELSESSIELCGAPEECPLNTGDVVYGDAY